MHSDSSQPGIAILMALYNGAPFVEEQLLSLDTQTHRNWTLHVSDDGSFDNGTQIINRFANRTARLIDIRQGPGRGYARNFLSLLDAPAPSDRHVAFCDQDDVWLPEKLERAVAALSAVPANVPALYGSRSWIWFAGRQEQRLSQHRPRPTGFRHALAQNFAGGNTMVFNRTALELALQARDAAQGVVSHDWWLYQLVTGAGGVAIYDPVPSIHYRQHLRNQIGANEGARAGLIRLQQVFAGRYAEWNEGNIAALQAVAHLLTEENRTVLACFADLRRRGVTGRLAGLRRSGVYRQSLKGNCALWLAALLGRM
jgi:glycosyltransferase involved in cell wall biosynthesis